MIRLFSVNSSSLSDREAELPALLLNRDEPGVWLQTCNRIEFYTGEGEVPLHVARHLFRVVSGLESCLLGEKAIQGQVRNAYREASEKYKLSRGIHLLFQTALFVGKKVRSESGISRGAMSHSQAAAEIISKNNPDLDKSVISLIGAHKMNEDIIRFLMNKGAETLFLANKTFAKAESLAEKFNCQVVRFDQLTDILKTSDVLISATSAPHVIISYDMFPAGKEMLILDLAFPRDIDSRIGSLPGVRLYNLEDVERLVEQNLDNRRSEALEAERIIKAEVEIFRNKQLRRSNAVQFK